MQSPRCALTAGTHSSVGSELRGKQPVSMPAPGLLASPFRQSCWRKRGTDGKGLVEGLPPFIGKPGPCSPALPSPFLSEPT